MTSIRRDRLRIQRNAPGVVSTVLEESLFARGGVSGWITSVPGNLTTHPNFEVKFHELRYGQRSCPKKKKNSLRNFCLELGISMGADAA